MTPRILFIAGSDSGGGAGIQADIKTVTMLGGHAMTAITAVTAQNTLGVDAVHLIPTPVVIAQIDSVVRDLGVDAVKIGMVGSPQTASAVAAYLARLTVPIVFDPVMIATSGAELADAATIASFERLMEVASVVTPNLPELEALGGKAAVLRFGCHLLVKGGHGGGDYVRDELWSSHGLVRELEGKRLDTNDTHGTGCTLASALACGLGQGMSIGDAFERAVSFVRIAILEAPGFGAGHGPLGQQGVRDFWEDDPVPDLSLNQVTVNTDDYAASVAFYKTLGLTQIVDSPDDSYARFEAGNKASLSVHRDPTHGVGGTTVYFECHDLDTRVTRLKAAGLIFTADPTDRAWLWREAELFDPFGNRVMLYRAGTNRLYPPWRI